MTLDLIIPKTLELETSKEILGELLTSGLMKLMR
jgi:hypothetical protein